MPRSISLVAPIRLIAMLAVLASVLAGPAYAAPDPPPPGTAFDYQLGGARDVPGHVGIVVRDRKADPVEDLYNVCYINGFQTQAEERGFWRRHWGLVLKKRGEPVVDDAWGEWLLDIRTDRKRSKLAGIVGRWIEKCADDGFAAVEFDNLDSFARSRGLIEPRHAKEYAALLVDRAHGEGLAAAQKNRAQWDGTRTGFDFAIAEECARWRECGAYVDHYGERLLAVEYRHQDFRRACRNWDSEIAIVRRDLALSTKGIRRWC